MITGDKFHTALSIGSSCGIINKDMKLFKIDYIHDRNAIEHELIKMNNKITKLSDEKKAIIFDMRSLGKILLYFNILFKLYKKFYNLKFFI